MRECAPTCAELGGETQTHCVDRNLGPRTMAGIGMNGFQVMRRAMRSKMGMVPISELKKYRDLAERDTVGGTKPTILLLLLTDKGRSRLAALKKLAKKQWRRHEDAEEKGFRCSRSWPRVQQSR